MSTDLYSVNTEVNDNAFATAMLLRKTSFVCVRHTQFILVCDNSDVHTVFNYLFEYTSTIIYGPVVVMSLGCSNISADIVFRYWKLDSNWCFKSNLIVSLAVILLSIKLHNQKMVGDLCQLNRSVVGSTKDSDTCCCSLTQFKI